jgi:uncharacterized RDD family membrane protein YckC
MTISKSRKRYFNAAYMSRAHVLQDHPLASFRRRLMAFAIDFVLVIVLSAIPLLPEALRLNAETGDFAMNIDPFHGWEILILLLYFGVWTYFGHGQTPGKKWMKIRVVSLTHTHLTLWHSFERSLGYGASLLEGGFGFLQFFIHPNRQTVHDRIAETIVVQADGFK